VDSDGEGRVWTGRQAKDRHLVDSLGEWDEAVVALRDVAKIDNDEKIDFEHWPKRESFLETLLEGHLDRMLTSEIVLRMRESLAASVSTSSALLWEPLSIR
jgi:protease-4